MSGPIVRKYGFPNFEKIFGERELAHGVDDTDEPQSEEAGKAAKPAKGKAAPKGAAKTPKKGKAK